MKTIAAVLALASAFAIAGHKERPWQAGTLLDCERNNYFEGVAVTAPAKFNGEHNVAGSNDAERAENPRGMSNSVDHYVVEAPDRVYLVERMRVGFVRPDTLIRYRQIKFAVEKSKLWLLDENGKEYQAEIVKTVPKKMSAQR